MTFPYIIYDPTTGEIMANGATDELSFESLKEANPQLHFLPLWGTKDDRVDLETLTIVPNEQK